MTAAKPSDAWVSFQVTVTQETRRRRRAVTDAPISVSVHLVSVGYGLGSDYRRELLRLTIPVTDGFQLAGAPEYAAELAQHAVREVYPGLF